MIRVRRNVKLSTARPEVIPGVHWIRIVRTSGLGTVRLVPERDGGDTQGITLPLGDDGWTPVGTPAAGRKVKVHLDNDACTCDIEWLDEAAPSSPPLPAPRPVLLVPLSAADSTTQFLHSTPIDSEPWAELAVIGAWAATTTAGDRLLVIPYWYARDGVTPVSNVNNTTGRDDYADTAASAGGVFATAAVELRIGPTVGSNTLSASWSMARTRAGRGLYGKVQFQQNRAAGAPAPCVFTGALYGVPPR
jgi:hypothetical protein